MLVVSGLVGAITPLTPSLESPDILLAVLDVLKVVGTDQITLDLRASNKPGIIRSGPNFLYVVMPVNLQ